MTRSVTLDARQRQALLDRYRKDPDPEVRFRAHILLLLADGHTWATVARAAVLQLPHHRPLGQAVPRGGRRGRGRAQARPPLSLRPPTGSPSSSTGSPPSCPTRLRLPPQPLVLRGRCVLMLWAPSARRQPRDRPALAAPRRHGLPPTAARPSGPRDEQREAKLDGSRQLLAELPADETVVLQDEVDINTNPEIGPMWMVKGSRPRSPRRGPTRSGTWPARSTGGPGRSSPPRAAEAGRNTALFLAHLDDLRHRLRRYRKIHVICDRPSSTRATRCRSTWRSTGIGSSWRCCRRTARTPTRWSGSGGTCMSRSLGIIGVRRWRSFGPDVRLAEEPESVQGRGLGLQREGRRLIHFPC